MTIKIEIKESNLIEGIRSSRSYNITGTNTERLYASETLKNVAPTIESNLNNYRSKIDEGRLKSSIGEW